MIVSTVGQTILWGLLIVVPLLYATDQLPQPSMMMAFVAAVPPPPPTPPPAPPPDHVRAMHEVAAPIEAPNEVLPEPASVDIQDEDTGFVAGDLAAGIIDAVEDGPVAPPPPPPPPPAPRAPLRIGGEIKPPKLLYRVEPVYPSIAVSAKVQGVVILEATIDEEGSVSDLRVLRSEPLLEKAAIEAVKQWRYAPVLLNGHPEKCVLTVVVSFRLEDL
jgi:protein TonB